MDIELVFCQSGLCSPCYVLVIDDSTWVNVCGFRSALVLTCQDMTCTRRLKTTSCRRSERRQSKEGNLRKEESRSICFPFNCAFTTGRLPSAHSCKPYSIDNETSQSLQAYNSHTHTLIMLRHPDHNFFPYSSTNRTTFRKLRKAHY